MSPQRRVALVSVGAAVALMGIKLVAGLASGSLGLVSEALHSGTDLVAALLTFFAIGVAGRPADRSHPYGHGKAEHLAALAEAFVLLLVSIAVGGLAVARLAGWIEIETSTAWWVFVAVGVVIAIDVLSHGRLDARREAVRKPGAGRELTPLRERSRRHDGGSRRAAGGQGRLAGRRLTGGALRRGPRRHGCGARLIRRNVDVLMDRAPVDAVRAARAAIATIDPPVEVRRLRLREAAGRTFTDVVIGVSPGAAVGQGHAVADRVEAVVQDALPGGDVVVHVEPAGEEAALRERVREAAMSVARVREIHNLSVIELPDGVHVSLHLKLPGDLPLDEAHAIAEQVERAIVVGVAEVVEVQSHLEPLAEPAAGREADDDPAEIERIVRELTGAPPRALRFLHTDEGLVVFLTLALDPAESLAARPCDGLARRAADEGGCPGSRRGDHPHGALTRRANRLNVRSMRLCMFHPNDNPLERGWVGRIDGDRVLHLAAQTLQSFFLGGGGAREHGEYPLAEVTLLVPVQYPPTVRVFSADGTFRFANATAVIGGRVPVEGDGPLTACARLAAVIGAAGAVGGFSGCSSGRIRPRSQTAKQSDFGIVLGPTVVTPDELDPGSAPFRLSGDGRQRRGHAGSLLLARGGRARRSANGAQAG